VEGAINQYREILRADPDHVSALNNLAWHLLESDPGQSLDYSEKAHNLSPDSGAILDTLALAQLKNNNMIEARRAIDRARALAPESPELRFHEAQIRAAEGDTTGAIDALSTLLAKHEEFSDRAKAEAFLKQLKQPFRVNIGD
jgi:tetratricopeptide (TPR) repeat protein